MTDTNHFLMSIFAFGLLFGRAGLLVLVAWRQFRPEWKRESLLFVDETTRRSYHCRYVQHVYGFRSGRYSGIEVDLPKALPHIFLDSHANDRSASQQMLIKSKERLSLEGDFDRYFQLFAPQAAHALALSIITPDVMQTLVEAVARYDVEIHDTHLRLITTEKVKNNPAIQQDLLHVATVLSREIDHKLSTWQESNLSNVPDLRILEPTALKISKRYVSAKVVVLGVFVLLTILPLLLLGIYMVTTGDSKGLEVIGYSVLLFPVSYIILRLFTK